MSELLAYRYLLAMSAIALLGFPLTLEPLLLLIGIWALFLATRSTPNPTPANGEADV